MHVLKIYYIWFYIILLIRIHSIICLSNTWSIYKSLFVPWKRVNNCAMVLIRIFSVAHFLLAISVVLAKSHSIPIRIGAEFLFVLSLIDFVSVCAHECRLFYYILTDFILFAVHLMFFYHLYFALSQLSQNVYF